MKMPTKELHPLSDKVAEAREMCLGHLRMVPREKRDAVADAIIALADPEWWETRRKGSDVFLLILEARKTDVLRIMREAAK